MRRERSREPGRTSGLRSSLSSVRRRALTAMFAAVAAIVALHTPSAAAEQTAAAAGRYEEQFENLLANGDFALGVAEDGIPLHWRSTGVLEQTEILVASTEKAADGYALELRDANPGRSVGVRSDPVPAVTGRTYRAAADVLVTEGDALVYLDFLDADGRRVLHRTVRARAADRWQRVEVQEAAPEGASFVTVILYSTIPNTGVILFDNAALHDLSGGSSGPGAVSDEPVSGRQLERRPEDGAMVAVNPPPLLWVPVPGTAGYAVELSRSPSFAAGETTRVEGLTLPLYVGPAALEPGEWHWRYWAMTRDGEWIGPSPVRRFRVEPGLPELPLPPREEWMSRVPREHPRLFVRPEELDALRGRLNLTILETIFSRARTAQFGVTLPVEPVDERQAGFDADTWRAGTNAIMDSLETLQELAFLYLLTGKEAYGREGKRLLLHLASFDPEGATSYDGHNEAFMRMLAYMPRAYSWLYSAMTEAERDVVRASMRTRGAYAYGRLKALPYESNPYSSHPGRMLGFLGQTALAFLGEIPEAEEWLDYVVTLMIAVYPAWGGDDGGYSEGLSYWRTYMNWVFDFVDALKVATGIDLYQKPFFRNTGYFKLYAHSVGTGGPFSDNQNNPPIEGDRAAMTHLARVYQNGHFRWYAEAAGGTAERSRIHTLLDKPPLPPATPPTDLPSARWFRDIGWVTFHSNLGEPKENIQFTFKSGPLGSVSHSHADQNAFALYAFGDGLAISSGYYPWSRSPHHENWTNQTVSKNSLLIDGRGQSIFDIEAKGEILGLVSGDGYEYTAGEAAPAYKDPNLRRFTRHVLYIRPGLFLIVDDVRTGTPVRLDWLLHSAFPLTWDPERRVAHAAGRNATLAAHLLWPTALDARVTDEFTPPPELTSYAKEWHLAASVAPQGTESVIVALLAVGKRGEATPEILDTHVDVRGADIEISVRYRTTGGVEEERVRMRLPGLESGPQMAAGLIAEGRDAGGNVVRRFTLGEPRAASANPGP